MARISTYNKIIDKVGLDKITMLCQLGATNLEMANFLGISEKTLSNWKNKHKDFAQAVKDGKLNSDAKVANSMYRRACGFTWIKQQAIKLKRVEYENGKKVKEWEEIELVEQIERVPPDSIACFFWLKNRRGQAWREKQEINVDTPELEEFKEAMKKIKANYKTNNEVEKINDKS